MNARGYNMRQKRVKFHVKSLKKISTKKHFQGYFLLHCYVATFQTESKGKTRGVSTAKWRSRWTITVGMKATMSCR